MDNKTVFQLWGRNIKNSQREERGALDKAEEFCKGYNQALKEAKPLLKTLNSEKWYETDADEQALAFAREHDEQWEFIDQYDLDEMVKHEAEQGALRVMCFLGKCESLNPLYG